MHTNAMTNRCTRLILPATAVLIATGCTSRVPILDQVTGDVPRAEEPVPVEYVPVHATTPEPTQIAVAEPMGAAPFLEGSADTWSGASTTGHAHSVAMHSPPAVDFHNDFDTMPQPANAQLVGIYGEIPGVNTPAANEDGSGNLWQITAATEGACFDPDVSSDGTLMALASTQHRKTADIYVKKTTGRTMMQITSDPAEDVMPVFGPDSQTIAFASNRDGNFNIYLTTTDGSPPVRLTEDQAEELHPTWSPDGQKIAYCKLGAQSGRWEIWVLDLNTQIQQFLEYGLFPRWNPDPGRNKIVFQRARERGSRLFSVWTLDYVDGEAMHPTEIVSAANAAAMHPAWSPDGNRICFVTVLDPDAPGNEEPEQADVWVVNVDGTSKTNLTNGRYRNLYPIWSANGTVFFLSNRSGADNIWAVATGRTIDPSEAGSGLATVDSDNAPGSDQP